MSEALKKILQNARIPRYTSYPTAPHFNDTINSDIVKNWYQNLHTSAKNISLYVHIPFCEKLCLFCACHMKVINTYSPVQQYLKLVEKEIKILSQHLHNCPPVTHLHFGGGSPTALTGDDFTHFMKILKRHFPIDDTTHVAVEIDPRTVDNTKIDAYVKAGMNRISLGIQDFNHDVQVAVNRVQPYELVKSVITTLKNKGIASINMDIMYGLPYQTLDTITDTVKQVLTLSPDRLSVFGYAHVPWMKKHQNLIPQETLPNHDMRWKMYCLIKDILCDNGYIAIGLDHFAKNTDTMAHAYTQKTLNRNFQGYTTDTADALIGIGYSSIGWNSTGYMQNTTSPTDYATMVNNADLPIIKGITLSNEDKVRRSIIEHIMCYMHVDLDAINAHYNTNYSFSKERTILQSYAKHGIIHIENNTITVPEKGRIALRLLASVFDTYFTPQQTRHSSAV